MVTTTRKQKKRLGQSTVGFIRLRKRNLTRKRYWINWPPLAGKAVRARRATQSFSYDLVRAVRIDGKPRHKFVLGFGSPVGSTIGFWRRVFGRTEKHGFTKDQQFQIADQLRRKGIPLPTVAECKAAKVKSIEWNKAYPDFASPPKTCDMLIAFIRRASSARENYSLNLHG